MDRWEGCYGRCCAWCAEVFGRGVGCYGCQDEVQRGELDGDLKLLHCAYKRSVESINHDQFVILHAGLCISLLVIVDASLILD